MVWGQQELLVLWAEKELHEEKLILRDGLGSHHRMDVMAVLLWDNRSDLKGLEGDLPLSLFTLLDSDISAGGRIWKWPGSPFSRRAVVSISGLACPNSRRRGLGGGGQGEALQPAQLPLSTSHARLLEGCLCRLSGFHRGGGCFIKVFGLLHKENVMISPILHRCDWLLQNRMCPREIRKWIFLYASPERKLSAAVFTLVKMILPSSVCNKHLGFLKSKAHEK